MAGKSKKINKKIKKTLNQKYNELNIIFNSSPTMIFYKDRKNRFIYVNAAFAKANGLSKGKIEGKTLWDLYPKEEADHYWKDDKEVIKSGEPKLDIIETMRTKKGLLWVQTNKIPYRNEKGDIIGIIGFTIDITKYKKTEEELKKAYSKLSEARVELIQAEKANAIVQLAGGVAHEVKNPLAIIMQATEYLKENVHSPKKNIQDTLNMIMDNIKRADHIIRTLSDFVRISELTLKSQDIKPTIIHSLDLIKPRVKLENIKIVKEFKKNFPRVLIDGAKMEQVFINLFLNAVQAMPNGGTIFIRGYTKKLDKLENRVGRRASDYFGLGEKAAIIEIEDTGAGISKENLQKLYTPFFTTKGPRGGAGLGLSVTRNIIEMHTGMIGVQSQENKGTKCIITLKIRGGK